MLVTVASLRSHPTSAILTRREMARNRHLPRFRRVFESSSDWRPNVANKVSQAARGEVAVVLTEIPGSTELQVNAGPL
jgi:hypothetical protein